MKKFLAGFGGVLVSPLIALIWWLPCWLAGIATTGLLWKFGRIDPKIVIIDLYGMTALIILIHSVPSLWSIWISGKTWGENIFHTSLQMMWDVSIFGITVNTVKWFWK